MEGDSNTFCSSSKRQPWSKLEHQQAWVQLRAKYLKDLLGQLDEIRDILAVKDYVTIKKRAHRIKGTSGTYCLDAIAQGAAKLERLADKQNPNAIVSGIDKVTRLVELETNRLNSPAVSSIDNSERSAND
jgi:HPt (histidine-containing phosphotransfer) domain-containing protein